jgi:hypothetical protein
MATRRLPDDDGTDFGSAPLAGGQITHTFTINNDSDGDLNLTGTPLVSFTGRQRATLRWSVPPPRR